MSTPNHDPHHDDDRGTAAESEASEDRRAILARRRRFIAAALSSLTLAGCAAATGPAGDAPPADSIDAQQEVVPIACLSRPFDVIDTPCLAADTIGNEASPIPCLDIDPDASVDGDPSSG